MEIVVILKTQLKSSSSLVYLTVIFELRIYTGSLSKMFVFLGLLPSKEFYGIGEDQ